MKCLVIPHWALFPVPVPAADVAEKSYEIPRKALCAVSVVNCMTSLSVWIHQIWRGAIWFDNPWLRTLFIAACVPPQLVYYWGVATMNQGHCFLRPTQDVTVFSFPSFLRTVPACEHHWGVQEKDRVRNVDWSNVFLLTCTFHICWIHHVISVRYLHQLYTGM